MQPPCEKHEELLNEAKSILRQINELSGRQVDVIIREGVSEHFILRDKQLELLMGEKERAIGALRQHDEEHRCQS